MLCELHRIPLVGALHGQLQIGREGVSFSPVASPSPCRGMCGGIAPWYDPGTSGPQPGTVPSTPTETALYPHDVLCGGAVSLWDSFLPWKER